MGWVGLVLLGAGLLSGWFLGLGVLLVGGVWGRAFLVSVLVLLSFYNASQHLFLLSPLSFQIWFFLPNLLSIFSDLFLLLTFLGPILSHFPLGRMWPIWPFPTFFPTSFWSLSFLFFLAHLSGSFLALSFSLLSVFLFWFLLFSYLLIFSFLLLWVFLLSPLSFLVSCPILPGQSEGLLLFFCLFLFFCISSKCCFSSPVGQVFWSSLLLPRIFSFQFLVVFSKLMIFLSALFFSWFLLFGSWLGSVFYSSLLLSSSTWAFHSL